MFALTGLLLAAAKTLDTDPARRLDCLQRRSACRPEGWEAGNWIPEVFLNARDGAEIPIDVFFLLAKT